MYNILNYLFVILASILPFAVLGFIPAFAQTCIEAGTCTFTNPLNFLIQPFLIMFGDWFYLIVWGLIIGIIHLRSNNPMLTGFVGIIVVTSLMGENLLNQSDDAIPILITLAGASIGFIAYALVRTKLNNPQA